MFKTIDEFLSQPANNRLIKYTAALSVLVGIFLTIPTPAVTEAQVALKYIQLFWLVLLTFTLTFLFINLTKFSWNKEKELMPKYGLPMMGTFSIFVGIILSGVILNLWRYLISLYSYSIAEFMVRIGGPMMVIIGLIIADIFMEKRKSNIPMVLMSLFYCFCFGVLCTIGGFYFQGLTTNYFHFYWFYPVFPIIFIASFLLSNILLIFHKKINIFKPYVPIQ